MAPQLDKLLKKPYIKSKIVPYIIKLVLGLLILFIAHVIGIYFSFTVINYINKQKERERVLKEQQKKYKRQFYLGYYLLADIIYYIFIVLGFLVILKLFGFEMSSIIALLGATGIAIGLGLQGILSDFASGIIISLDRTFFIGDYLEIDGMIGQVKKISVIYTTLEEVRTHKIIKVPNRRFQEGVVSNLSNEKGYVTTYIDISNSTENKPFPEIFKAIERAIMTHPKITEKPIIGISSMTEFATRIQVRVKARYYPELEGELNKLIRIALQKEYVMLSMSGEDQA
jgi:small conductance mechanosensitive channel